MKIAVLNLVSASLVSDAPVLLSFGTVLLRDFAIEEGRLLDPDTVRVTSSERAYLIPSDTEGEEHVVGESFAQMSGMTGKPCGYMVRWEGEAR